MHYTTSPCPRLVLCKEISHYFWQCEIQLYCKNVINEGAKMFASFIITRVIIFDVITVTTKEMNWKTMSVPFSLHGMA